MTPLIRVALLLGAVGALAVPSPVTASAAVTEASDVELAARWAPVHYQDTDSSDYDADYLTAVDFDGDWNARNNWESQDDSVSRLVGSVYYSVVATSTHWFLVYGFYHPRDWTEFDPFGLFTHENDMEGVLLTVRRDGSAFGVLEAMVTVAHSNFYSYVPAGSPYTAGRETVDGPLLLQTVDGVARPTSRQEAKGHGCFAWNGGSFPGGDGVVYFPSAAGVGEVPSNGNDRSVAYRLVDVFAAGGLWAHRSDSLTFASFGTFRGDNGQDNAANAPWGWDDGDDGSDLPRGLLATDPAKLVSTYFGNEGTFSLTYERNGYR
jgi:hypothetical protein